MRVAVQLERGGVPYVIDSLLLDCLILPLEGILQSSYYYKLATAVSFFQGRHNLSNAICVTLPLCSPPGVGALGRPIC